MGELTSGWMMVGWKFTLNSKANWMDGQTDRQTNRWMDVWMERKRDKQVDG